MKGYWNGDGRLNDALIGKKIACLGNMNNNFFALARYLRDRKVAVDVFVPDGIQDHFLPDNDTYESLPEWIYKVPWGLKPPSVLLPRAGYERVLNEYDLLIGHTYAPALCKRVGRRLDIFIPHGADLYALPFAAAKRFWRRSKTQRIAELQKKGIQEARAVVINARAPVYTNALQKLGVEAIEMSLPALYDKEYDAESIRHHAAGLKYYDRFLELRKKNDIIVFSHARQLWRKEIDSAEVGKGNDLLIEGFAGFCRASKARAVLILFEYGPDVGRSKGLIAELGIDDRVVWMPVMPRKEIMPGLALADVAADQFLSGAFGGSGHEALAMGKPLLVYLNTREGEDGEINLPPCINVKSAEEICGALLSYEQDRLGYWTMGEAAKRWFDRFRGRGLADAMVFLMAGLSRGMNVPDLRAGVYQYLRGEGNAPKEGAESEAQNV